MEILKIMDKTTFQYDLDVGPQSHIYYYITACLYTIKGVNNIDLSRTIHYLINIMIIVYKNSESFENLPPLFYEKIFKLIEAIHQNKNKQYFLKEDDSNLSKMEVSLIIFMILEKT